MRRTYIKKSIFCVLEIEIEIEQIAVENEQIVGENEQIVGENEQIVGDNVQIAVENEQIAIEDLPSNSTPRANPVAKGYPIEGDDEDVFYTPTHEVKSNF